MTPRVTAGIAGVIFGFGLALSQMIDRQRILGFLDITGAWDPTLLFVLGGAVGVTIVTFRMVLRQPRPLFAETFRLPTRRDVDRPLLLGAAIFGIGWGIGGYCPGPGIAAIAMGIWPPVLFTASLIAGSLLHAGLSSRGR